MSANRVLVADSAQSAVETIFPKVLEWRLAVLKENIALHSVIVLSTKSKNVRHWREQTDLYSHLHTQRSPSAVSAPLPPAQAPPVAPGCSACSSTLQGLADRLRSSANTSGQNTAFCFCLQSNGFGDWDGNKCCRVSHYLTLNYCFCELVQTWLSIKYGNIFFKALLINIVEDIRKDLI